MRNISAWFLYGALAHALAAQPIIDKPPEPDAFNRVWDIPALSYGPNEWSVLRLTNQAEISRSVRVDVYSERGDRLPIGPELMVDPHQSVDIRIDRNSRKEEMCWARVVSDGLGGLTVTPIVEILSGNELFDYPREPREFSTRNAWGFRASDAQFKTLYFLNGFDAPTVVTFCESNRRDRDPCGGKSGSPARFTVGPHQSVTVDVRRLRQRYFFVLSSVPRAGLLVVLRDGAGRRKQFTSESTIQFGEQK